MSLMTLRIGQLLVTPELTKTSPILIRVFVSGVVSKTVSREVNECGEQPGSSHTVTAFRRQTLSASSCCCCDNPALTALDCSRVLRLLSSVFHPRKMDVPGKAV